jgi:hypothetical protein
MEALLVQAVRAEAGCGGERERLEVARERTIASSAANRRALRKYGRIDLVCLNVIIQSGG